MLHVQIEKANLLAILTPEGALAKSDFELAAKKIDPLIEDAGELNGIIIHVEKFPGWGSFAAFSTHLNFVKQHHRQIRRVALVTDSTLVDFAEKLASHFVAAELKHFAYDRIDDAKAWIAELAGDPQPND